MKLKVEVTQADIDKGMTCEACFCPAALAIRRAMDLPEPALESNYAHNRRVRVLDSAVMIDDHKYDMPQTLYDFVGNYDSDEVVAPFTFELEI